ncbi:potassium channel tetramerization domain containing 14 S homeolog [Xenopus laevis]|uniref:MGC82296 protein n=1 Tax=Xenopus laevis TaxID=8355 RepID=Q6NTT4_XENLA|nr:potassium channel tetramerization domain containing 14 S homeolog [Xenopus laevis]AAH68871.1 MGC82296 protein [Xenopus laevis]
MSVSGKQLSSSPQGLSPIVQLNIGGEIYTTTLSTLKRCSGSKLFDLFNGQPKLRTDSEGRFFIDRDGKYFRYILEYLRTNQVPTEFVKEVYKEALFYDIEPLVKILEESPVIFGEIVGKKQFLARVPNYSENIEVIIRIARAEVVASRYSNVIVCVARTEDDVGKCHDAFNSLHMDKESVVKFGPWKASPGISDLLDCIKADIEQKGYNVTYMTYVADKGFLSKSYDYFYKFVFTWW